VQDLAIPPQQAVPAADVHLVNKFGRARLAHGSRGPARSPLPHPDAARTTRRMPFHQLRSLVLALVEAEDDAVSEFESMPTTHRPSTPRVSTLDEVIASLSRGEPRG
jgi:hypothetical protein